MDIPNKQPMTIDDLAVVVAEGFNDVTERMATKEDLKEIKEDIKGLSDRLEKVEHGQQALKSNVNNYLELSEKRYTELKQRDAVLAK